MKGLKKMLAVVTAVSAIAASVPAFAAVSGDFTSANGAVSADYTAFDQNKVKAVVDASKAVVGKEMSFIVLDNDVTASKITNGAIVADDILYIDQATLGSGNYTFVATIDPTRANGATSSATELPAGSYPIRLGYYYDVSSTPTFAIAEATMVVSADSSGTIVKIVVGDVNDGEYTGTATSDITKVTAADAFAILNLAIGGSTSVGGAYDIGAVVADKDGKKIVVGDVNDGLYTGTATSDMTKVTAADAFAILNLAIGGSTSVGGAYDIGTVVSTVANN